MKDKTIKDKTIAVRISQEEKKGLKAMAKKKGFRNISGFLYWLIQNDLKK